MNNKTPYRHLIALAFLLLPTGNLVAAESLTLRQAVQRIINHHPSVKLSKLQVDKSSQEIARADSQLGWQLNAEVGASHDLGFTYAPVDKNTAGIGLQRQLKSGGTLGVQGGYAYDDNSAPLAGFPNPLTTTSADISYRKPLRQGSGNPLYAQGSISARSGLKISQAGHHALMNQLVQQTIDLYYGLAITQARKQNSENGVTRAERLLQFVKNNSRLGLAEKKDLLQAQAQLRGQRADLEGVKTLWEQQRTSLNRLMGRPWNQEFVITSTNSEGTVSQDLASLINETENNSPDLVRLNSQLEIADATVKVSKDKYKSKLDLVMSAGSRTGSGPGLDLTDYAASVKLEYQRPLSRQGLKAEFYQAQISQDIARREIIKVRDDLKYQVQGLVAEINTGENALQAFKDRLSTEQEKLKETKQRYRSGRADTSQLIQFENELSFAEFSVNQQSIDLARKQHALKLLRGALWDEFQLENTGLEAQK